MAFGISKAELNKWKKKASQGEIAIITHFWNDDRFPQSTSVTKVGCSDIEKLIEWGNRYALKKEWIDYNHFPHFDVFGLKQKEILQSEGYSDQLKRFNLLN